jgi:hypothetical protein
MYTIYFKIQPLGILSKYEHMATLTYLGNKISNSESQKWTRIKLLI